MQVPMILLQVRPPEQPFQALSILPLAIAVLILILLLVEHTYHNRQARRMGYRSYREYLRSVPRTDAEKQDAVNMTSRGVVLCVLGILFPPLVIVGLFPLYRGLRKLGLLWSGVSPALPPSTSDAAGQPQP